MIIDADIHVSCDECGYLGVKVIQFKITKYQFCESCLNKNGIISFSKQEFNKLTDYLVHIKYGFPLEMECHNILERLKNVHI